MTKRTFDGDTERRAASVRATDERDSDSSVRSSPVGTLHRRVGNQAVQENYTPSELRDPLGLGGSSDRPDGQSTTERTSESDRQSIRRPSGDAETSDTQESSSDNGTSEDRKTSGEKSRPHGPNRTGKFVVEFDDDKVPGWKTVTIPAMSVEQGSYREGNEEVPEQKEVAGRPTYDGIELKADFVDSLFFRWNQSLTAESVAEVAANATVRETSDDDAATRWEFTKCWPDDYDAPDLDASADGDADTESLTADFDKLTREE